MGIKETEAKVRLVMFKNSLEFDQYLKTRRLESRAASRAIGILEPDGTIEVVMDKSYYLKGGIKQTQLPAIVEHEVIELSTKCPDAHQAGIIAEYRFIFNQDGESGLRQYHSHLCSLIGGRNDTRNSALIEVLGK